MQFCVEIWNFRTKGRDLYDYLFYLSKNIPVNLELIREKLIDSDYFSKDEELSLEKIKEMLNKKFNEINYTDAKEDVISFINDTDSLDLWNVYFFTEITKSLKAK